MRITELNHTYNKNFCIQPYSVYLNRMSLNISWKLVSQGKITLWLSFFDRKGGMDKEKDVRAGPPSVTMYGSEGVVSDSSRQKEDEGEKKV